MFKDICTFIPVSIPFRSSPQEKWQMVGYWNLLLSTTEVTQHNVGYAEIVHDESHTAQARTDRRC
jgi:hypothetical protein